MPFLRICSHLYDTLHRVGLVVFVRTPKQMKLLAQIDLYKAFMNEGSFQDFNAVYNKT